MRPYDPGYRAPRSGRVLAAALAGVVCGLLPIAGSLTTAASPSPSLASTSIPSPSLASTSSPGLRVAVVGDMVCPVRCPRSADVAALVTSLHPDAFLGLGDLLNNTADWSLYDAQWGTLKGITYPLPGNHEYSADIDAYNQYWGDAAHAPLHYYSFDLGSWHVVALNGEADTSSGSPQETWFQADLAAHPAACTAVLIHGPRWSSSNDHPSDPSLQALWGVAVGGHVDLWLSGHNHLYERFDPLDADGLPYDDGTTEMVIGTGGRQLHRFDREPLQGEVIRDNETFGAGLFTLGDGRWSMEFLPIPGQTFTDSASGTCH